jgi:hypothetical protein
MTSSHPKTPKAGSQRTSALATVLTLTVRVKASNGPVTRIHKVKELHLGSIPRCGFYLSFPDSQQTVSTTRRAAVLPQGIVGGIGKFNQQTTEQRKTKMQDKPKKKDIKVRDMKPSKDAKGGIPPGPCGPGHGITGPGHGVTRPGNSNT